MGNIKETKQVTKEGTLSAEEVYAATLKLRSVGANPQIVPTIEWSHVLEGDPLERAENELLPHSYIAMSQIMAMINGAIREVAADVEEDDMPSDPDELARTLTAMDEKKADGKKPH